LIWSKRRKKKKRKKKKRRFEREKKVFQQVSLKVWEGQAFGTSPSFDLHPFGQRCCSQNQRRNQREIRRERLKGE
jgi:hypothetical protein